MSSNKEEIETVPASELDSGRDPATNKPAGLMLTENQVELDTAGDEKILYAVTIVKTDNRTFCLPTTLVDGEEFEYDLDEVLGLISVQKARIEAFMSAKITLQLLGDSE